MAKAPYQIRPEVVGPVGPPGYGVFPPRADQQKSGAADVVSGRERIAQASIPALPLLAVGVLAGVWPKPLRRTLILGVGAARFSNAGPSSDTASYPPGAGTGSTNQSHLNYDAGFVDQMGTVWGGIRNVACVIELGCGGATSRITMDWRQGSYRLPPCDFCRIAAQPWGTGWPASVVPFDAIAAVVPDDMDGAHVPTASGVLAAPGVGGVSILTVPNGARAVDVEPAAEVVVASANIITVRGAAYGVRNYATGAFVPGWSPLAVADQNDSGNAPSVNVISALDEPIRLRWYLQL